MWAVIGILVVAALISVIEVPSMIKRKLKKELWVFSALLLLGAAAAIAQAKHVTLPNPLDWITYIYKPVSDALLQILG